MITLASCCSMELLSGIPKVYICLFTFCHFKLKLYTLSLDMNDDEKILSVSQLLYVHVPYILAIIFNLMSLQYSPHGTRASCTSYM